MTHLIKFYLPYVRHHLHVCSVNTFASGSHPAYTRTIPGPECVCACVRVCGHCWYLFVYLLPMWHPSELIPPFVETTMNQFYCLSLTTFYAFFNKAKNVLFWPANRYRYMSILCIHIVNQRARYTRNYESQTVAWSMPSLY